MSLTHIVLEAPYLLFMGDAENDGAAKTGYGIAYWSADRCAGQMRLPGCKVNVGLPELGVDQAVAAAVRTAIIGVAPRGGRIADHWVPPLVELAHVIASGMHSRLTHIPRLVAAAAAGGAKLIDVRVPAKDLPCGTGRKRSGKRVLTVGTDCAVGKKYSALALQRELAARGIKATFRATGQTGIMICGSGIPIDAVVADFIAGAAEMLSPDNDADHWDVIEGQGSLLHPSYAGVALGLLHGSQPDAVVLCHDAGRTAILGLEGRYPMPAIDAAIDTVLRAAKLTNPDCVCVGISVNTSHLSEAERRDYLRELEQKHGLPSVDPVATGIGAIADRLLG